MRIQGSPRLSYSFRLQDAIYLLKCLQGFVSLGIRPYAISVQNEPQYSNPTYPTASFTPDIEGQVARALRGAMENNGLADIKLIGMKWIIVNVSYILHIPL